MQMTLPWLSEALSVFNLCLTVTQRTFRIFGKKNQQPESSQKPKKKQIELQYIQRMEEACQTYLDKAEQIHPPKDIYSAIMEISKCAKRLIETLDSPEYDQKKIISLLEEIQTISKGPIQGQRLELNEKRAFSDAFKDQSDDLEPNLIKKRDTTADLKYILPRWYRDFIHISFQNTFCIDFQQKSIQMDSKHFTEMREMIIAKLKTKTVEAMSKYWIMLSDLLANATESVKNRLGYEKKQILREITSIELNCPGYVTSGMLKFIIDFIKTSSKELEIIKLDLSNHNEEDDHLSLMKLKSLFEVLGTIPQLHSVSLNLNGRELNLETLRQLIFNLSSSAKNLEAIALYLSGCDECHDFISFIGTEFYEYSTEDSDDLPVNISCSRCGGKDLEKYFEENYEQDCNRCEEYRLLKRRDIRFHLNSE